MDDTTANLYLDCVNLQEDLEEDEVLPKSVRRALEAQGIPDPKANVVLCDKCYLECLTTYKAILEGLD